MTEDFIQNYSTGLIVSAISLRQKKFKNIRLQGYQRAFGIKSKAVHINSNLLLKTNLQKNKNVIKPSGN